MPVVSAYTAFTASHLLIVTADGVNRSPVTIWMVVVEPLPVHVVAFVVVADRAGFGPGLAAECVAAGVGEADGRLDGEDVVVAACVAATRCVPAAPLGWSGVADTERADVGLPSTCTLAAPLLHAVASSRLTAAAVNIPVMRMSVITDRSGAWFSRRRR